MSISGLIKETLDTGLDYIFQTNNAEFALTIQKAIQISKFDTSVLIKGETGTGKEVFSRFIHSLSDKKHGPFKILSFPILRQNEPEFVLFGYTKGALIGQEIAQEEKIGLIEYANKGVLSIDELMDIPLSSQGKFSHFLDTKEFTPLGSNESRKVDVRVIASTSRDLELEVEEKRLREDIYFRFNVVSITLPPLRERREDVKLFIDYYSEYYSKRYGIKNIQYDSDCYELFINYNWPGNIRELTNVVSALIVTNTRNGVITVDDVKPSLQNSVLQKKTFKAILKMPQEIKTAIKQYLNFFNDYLHSSKGIMTNFEVVSIDDGLELFTKASSQKEIEILNSHLKEYVDFIRKNISDIAVKFEVERDETEKELLLLSLKNEIQQLKFKLELKNYQMKFLESAIDKFYNLLGVKYSNPAPLITSITQENTQIQKNTNDLKIIINNGIQNIRSELLKLNVNFINEYPDMESNLRSVEDELGNRDNNDNKDANKRIGFFNELRKFVVKFLDKHKAIEGAVKKGEDWLAIIQRIRHLYNGIANIIGIPEIL